MWQEIVTYGIGVFVVIYLFIQIYRFFCNKEKGANKCEGCSGCILKERKKKS